MKANWVVVLGTVRGLALSRREAAFVGGVLVSGSLDEKEGSSGRCTTLDVAKRTWAMEDGPVRAVDGHLHVWTSSKAFASPPPEGLDKEEASVESFSEIMKKNKVEAAVITQPINYKFDHSYIASVIADAPETYRGVLLADPDLPAASLEATIRTLREAGFTGVRVNPGLWGDRPLNNDAGRMIFRCCSDLGMPVCVMAFQTGFSKELKSVLSELSNEFPAAPIVLDHFAFPRQDPASPPSELLKFDDDAFERLLDFGRTVPNSYVKISALFRCSSRGPPYDDLEPKFNQLLQVYGPDRLFFGSDFPYVILPQNHGYSASIDAVRAWLDRLPGPSAASVAHDVLYATAKRLFF